ncbi:lipopolysaccharide biosynthesis protein [Acinetobacter sp. AM]|uniref:glycosyltransferase n=1 Tax=Acinetobacter sp. AM TaxID=2170730 RepID=UPI000DE75E86|nr:glycosyltransferase [Acinetobacter sp. AM]PWB17350.1 lipopolysaccharide biosynthesis protein [Acinetobacter sp. AM]
MKILHTLHWIQFAGTEKVCVDLCNEMSKEHQVYLLSNEKILPYLNNEIQLIDFDFEKNRYNPLFLYQTAKLLDKISPDIIHCHNTKEIEIMKYAQFFLTKKIPIIATKHTLQYKKKYNLADLCVAILEDTKQLLKQESIIIKNGMAYQPPTKIARPNKFYIVLSGRLDKMKGFDIAIEALSLLNFDFECHIFGQGEEQANLQQQINALKLQDKVLLKGFSNHINDVLYSCDLQIIPSRFEPYGLVAIDAIYYAPLMISSHTGISEQILSEILKFDSNPQALSAKITEVYSNYSNFVAIFEQIKATKDIFSIEKMTTSYLESYQNLIASYGSN